MAGLRKSQLSFRRGCANTDQILALKDIIKQCWETSECAKWTIRKHNTHSGDVGGTEVPGRLHREITGDDRWRSHWTHTWGDANHSLWCFCDNDFNPVGNGLEPLVHTPPVALPMDANGLQPWGQENCVTPRSWGSWTSLCGLCEQLRAPHTPLLHFWLSEWHIPLPRTYGSFNLLSEPTTKFILHVQWPFSCVARGQKSQILEGLTKLVHSISSWEPGQQFMDPLTRSVREISPVFM